MSKENAVISLMSDISKLVEKLETEYPDDIYYEEILETLISSVKKLNNSFTEYSSDNKSRIKNVENKNKTLNDILFETDIKFNEIEELYKTEKQNFININKQCVEYKNTINDARDFIYDLEKSISDKNKEIKELEKEKLEALRKNQSEYKEKIVISIPEEPKVAVNQKQEEKIKDLQYKLDECHILLADYQKKLADADLLNKQLEEQNIKIEKEHLEYIKSTNIIKEKTPSISLYDEIDFIDKQKDFDKLKTRNNQLESEILELKKQDLKSVNMTTPLLKYDDAKERNRCYCIVI